MLVAVSLLDPVATEAQSVQHSSGLASNAGQVKAEAAAALAADSNQQVQQQLWSLFMSCFKAVIAPSNLAAGSACAAGGRFSDGHDHAATLYFAAEALLDSAAQDSNSSSSKKRQDQLCCWLVYAARYLRFQCKELVAAAAPPPAAATEAAASLQQQENPATATASAAVAPAATTASPEHESAIGSLLDPGYALAKVQLIAEFIAQQLRSMSKQQPEFSAAAAAAASTLDDCAHLQALLKQYGPALDELERKAIEVCEAEHEPCRTRQAALQRDGAALGPQLLQQVLHFAEGVCAALPLRHCCNNPGCINLGGLSEAGLVAGAGSRCSRCRACYYCSRECQLAAWPLHKPVCKRLQAAEAATAAAALVAAATSK
jgi:hypothetical protein